MYLFSQSTFPFAVLFNITHQEM